MALYKSGLLKTLGVLMTEMLIFVLIAALAFSSVKTAKAEGMESQAAQTIQSNDDANHHSSHHTSHYAFVLFYMGSCPHCQHFDPVLKEEAEMLNIPVYPFTLDGQSLPSFPDSATPTQDILKSFFGEKSTVTVPTLFLINVNNLHTYPVSQGELTQEELSNRLLQLTNDIQSKEGGA